MVEKQRCPLQRDSAYRWFSELSSAQRVEFLCGLLDLCLPLELRFLGCCLEDLARKDYHSLRDSEIKANNPADLGRLTNLTDEVVRSRLLVSLALLSADNREAAGVLCRTLTHIDSIINNYGLQLNDARTGDEFLLLFTMASNHPAFSFHQKQVLRQELSQIQSIIDSSAVTTGQVPTATTSTTTTVHSPNCYKVISRIETHSNSASNSLEKALHTSVHSIEETLPKRHSGKNSKVNVEKIVLKGLPQKNERALDCSFEVCWSDSSVTSVTKSSTEVTEFLLKLSQLFPEEHLEKCIPYRFGADSISLENHHVDLKLDLRFLASLPSHLLKIDHVRKFFSTSSPIQHHQSASPNTSSHHKLNTTVGAPVRPICGVASIQSSQSSTLHHATPGVPVSPYIHSGSAGSTVPYRSQMDASSSLLMSSNLQSPQTQEQQEILEWLRKLRLHKYYTVFSQLSMKKFLSLTEEDLNKFESLTMGAKKKLKTQLELEKEKSGKRCINPAMCSVNNGIARVPPTSHVEPFQRCHRVPEFAKVMQGVTILLGDINTVLNTALDRSSASNTSQELRVDIEQFSHHMHREGSSSSEYSSSPSSPRGIQPREESFDSAEETERCPDLPLEGPEREKPIILLNHYTSSAVRPTAQVLPVQNEAGSNTTNQHPLQMMNAMSSHLLPSHIMNLHKSDRVDMDMKLLSSSMHSCLPLEERSKASPGPRSSIKVEKSFGNMIMDLPAHSSLPVQVISGVPENTSGAACVNFGMRAKVLHSSTVDQVIKPAQQQIVENSTAATMKSSTVFHAARPSVKLLVSSASDSTVVRQICSSNMQSVSSAVINPRTSLYAPNTKVAFSGVSSMPVAPIPGSFCPNSNTAPSSSHPATSFANVANLPSCTAPSSTPAISSVCEKNVYSSSNSGTAVNVAIPIQTPHNSHQQQQSGCTVCSSCGCSGNCGTAGTAASYANYFQHPFSAPSMFSFPFLPFNPLCRNGYINAHQYNSNPMFPVVHSPYNSSLNSTDSVIKGQSNFAVSPFQNFITGTAGVYQPQGIMVNTNSAGLKKNSNLSCYNCGSSGHRAHDCKLPSMDFNQPGSFRLKYAPASESLDSAE